jgi:hypothetical protein
MPLNMYPSLSFSMIVTSRPALSQKLIKLLFVFPALSNDKHAPVNRENPTNQNVCEEELEDTDHEKSLTPLISKTTDYHGTTARYDNIQNEADILPGGFQLRNICDEVPYLSIFVININDFVFHEIYGLLLSNIKLFFI